LSPDDYDTNLCSGRPVSGLTTLKNGTIVVFRGQHICFIAALILVQSIYILQFLRISRNRIVEFTEQWTKCSWTSMCLFPFLLYRTLFLDTGQIQKSWSSSVNNKGLGNPVSHRHRLHPLQLHGENLLLQGSYTDIRTKHFISLHIFITEVVSKKCWTTTDVSCLHIFHRERTTGGLTTVWWIMVFPNSSARASDRLVTSQLLYLYLSTEAEKSL